MSNRFSLAGVALALVLVAACGGEGTSALEPPAKPPAPVEKPADVKFDLSTLKADATDAALVPSPTEMQRALAKAGIQTRLADMVKNRNVSVAVSNPDQVAIRTGVVMADLVLSVHKAPEAQLARMLVEIKDGLVRLGGGDDVRRTIDDLKASIANQAVSRNDLEHQLDELAGVMVPELSFEAGDDVLPLIQAGGWLEGAWLVSGAIEQEGRYDAGTALLRQPEVVAYFQRYVAEKGKDKAPDAVVSKLRETLDTLQEITAKPQLSEQDVKTIHRATAAVLSLL